MSEQSSKTLSVNKRRRLNIINKNKSQDVSQDVPQDVSQNVPQDVSQNVTKDVSQDVTKEKIEEAKAQILNQAKTLWEEYKLYIKTHTDFRFKSDKEKYDIFRRIDRWKSFIDEYPIVSKYMICLGQFHIKALDKYLTKIQNVATKPHDITDKQYNEKQWCERQADYVVYLFDIYNKNKHPSPAERKLLWEKTYNIVKGEFDDFRKTHDEVKEKIEIEKKLLEARNVKDLLNRIISGTQKVSEEDEKFLLEQLEILTYKKTFDTSLSQLLKSKPILVKKDDLLSYTIESTGKGPEKHQKISMTEYVDAERMHEIDDKFKSDEYKGLVAVKEGEIIDEKDIIFIDQNGKHLTAEEMKRLNQTSPF